MVQLYKQKRLLSAMMLTLLILSIASTVFAISVTAVHNKHGEFPEEFEVYDEWIIKWKKAYSQPVSDDFSILYKSKDRRLLLVQLKKDVDIEKWYLKWSKREDIEYIEPNFTMKISAAPNDPGYSSQSYLQQIGAPEAWDIEKSSTRSVIAILDTGVDLSHPDLKENLVDGINLLNTKLPPQDDHGHGTQVAGVLGARGNNSLGVSGILWSAKLMPVKVLDKEGEGKPFTVSQGIYEAVDRSANIILLSLGDPIYTKTLQEAVEYAESKGALVIAATGNEGARVNYPAAFPTVLGVGAVDLNKRPLSYSNSGPEVGVVAPGRVYTTQLNGQYGTFSGTSMAAPQVAGLAALIIERNPALKPSEVRNHIYYTSQDVHSKGWDLQTGHGFIDMAKALSTRPVPDMYEPNNTIAQASVFPIETMVRAQLSSKSDIDWYKIDAPYRGKIKLKIEMDVIKSNGINVTFFPNGNDKSSVLYNIKKDREVEINVPKGVSYLSVQYHASEKHTTPLGYQITNQFTIYADAQSPNHSKVQATRLSGNGESIVGTFDQDGITDWFVFQAPKKGQIDLQVSTDTTRLDPVIIFERPNGRLTKIDDGNVSNGQEERFVTEVDAGTHYIRLSHYYGHKVNGEYYLRFSFKPYIEDAYEPNNSKDAAALIPINRSIQATISTKDDVDWYRVEVTKESYLHLELKGIPSQSGTFIGLYTNNLQFIAGQKQGKENVLAIGDKLKAGTYYIKVSADTPYPFDAYQLNAAQQELISGFRDIKGHWAMNDIIKASESGLVQGKGNYRFAPGETISRAEVAIILQRLYRYPAAKVTYQYQDLSKEHWAYDDIQRLSEAAVMRGYSNGSFGVNKNVTRAEVAVILDRILFSGTPLNTNKKYSDVSEGYWAYSSIMRLSEAGYLQGDKQGTFRPAAFMTRAEFVTLINRIQAK